jgi:hypothetical protein
MCSTGVRTHRLSCNQRCSRPVNTVVRHLAQGNETMLITPIRGKRIFAFLMILAGVGIIAGLVKESIQSRARTSIAEVHLLNHYQTGTGIGSVRQSSVHITYEFFVNGVRFEKQQLVDSLPSETVYVRYDPQQPNNNALDLDNSNPQIMSVAAGIVIVLGSLLGWHTWKPFALLRSGQTTKTWHQ